MSTDNYKQVLYNDGEGITYGDLNDMQRYLESKIWEQIIHNSIGSISIVSADRDLDMGGQDGTDHPSSRAYCLNPGAAYLRNGSVYPNKVQIAPGTLLQKIAASTGNDPGLIAYTFVGTEEWTLTAGNAANPRVDLLQMKLEYVSSDLQSRDFEDASTRIVTTTSMSKKRRVQCTLSVKAGTPAVSPFIPEPDAGYVPVGSVMVPANWNTATGDLHFGDDTGSATTATVQDQRMPINVKAYIVDPINFFLISNATLTAHNTKVTFSALGQIQIPCPVLKGRLLGVGLHHPDAGVMTTQALQFYSSLGAGNMNTLPKNLNSTDLQVSNYFSFESAHLPASGPTIQQSVTTKIGMPIWANGFRSPIETVRLSGTSSNPIIFRVVVNITSTVNVGSAIFYVAEGI